MTDLAPAPLRVVLFLPGLWGMPSASPFGSKLMMWLRMAGIPHRGEAVRGRPQSRSGKIPYLISPDGSILADSSVIIEELMARHQPPLEQGFTAEQRGRMIAVQRLCEDSLYWAIVWSRWIHEPGWAITRDAYLGRLSALPRAIVAPMLRRQVRAQLQGHGLGRHDPERIWQIGAQDLEALDGLLGDQEYFCGAPSRADAAAWGMLSGLVRSPLKDPLTAKMASLPRLVAFVERLEQRYPAGG